MPIRRNSRLSVRLLLLGLLVVGPLASIDAAAQPANWRVTVIEIFSVDDETLCAGASVTMTVVPGPTGDANANICGVQGHLNVTAQHVTFELTGAASVGGCKWNITEPIRGTNFISGDAVPATSMRGEAQGVCEGYTFRNAVFGSFQAQRVVGGGGAAITDVTGNVEVTLPGQDAIILTPVTAAGLVLPPGTGISVGPAGSLTLATAGGSTKLGANTRMALVTARFFLLVPTF